MSVGISGLLLVAGAACEDLNSDALQVGLVWISGCLVWRLVLGKPVTCGSSQHLRWCEHTSVIERSVNL
jgi:hypothetical protein